MEKPVIVTPEIVYQFQQKIIDHKPKYIPAPPIAEVKQFQQTDSALNETWHFWIKKSTGTENRHNDAKQNEARKLYDEHSSLRSVWNNWTTMSAGLERLVNLKQIKRSASVRNLIRYNTTHNLLSRYSYLDRSQEELFNDEDEQIVAINIAHLQVGFHDVRDFFEQYDRHYMYQEGRIIVLIDKNGKIQDFNHHIHPYYKIDLFADEIFESWYKTDVLFKKVMKTNSYLKQLGQKYNNNPVNNPQVALTTDEPILFEIVMSLTDQGKFAYCMCADYRDMGMRPSVKQTRILLEALNRINTSNIWNINLNLDEDTLNTNNNTPPSGSSPVPAASPIPGTPSSGNCSKSSSPNMNDNRKRPQSTNPAQVLLDPAIVNELTSKYIRKSLDVKAVNNIGQLRHRRQLSLQMTGKPMKKSIKSFMTTPVIMSPNVLVLLDWMQKEGRITYLRYTRRVKFYMEFIRDWLSELYESAQSPMNLGLRMLLLGERKMIDVR